MNKEVVVPIISVLLAANKLDDYIWLAISSILEQKDISFELILIANGIDCEIVSAEFSRRYGTLDNVVILKTSIPQLAYALNLGISIARADIIARMDADDISLPKRLAIQYSYMNAHGLDLVGSDVFIIDVLGSVQCQRVYPRAQMIDRLLPFKNCFCHPSVMCKKSLLYQVRGYNAGFNSEDYDLWLRLMRVGVRWDNIDKPLLYYRVHQSSAQGTRLAYAECLALSVREFFINKSLVRFLAMCSHVVRFFYKKMS
ncbi:glycosyl transferase [Aeromonas caviae]|nr:glycosyl transferase [Aeromonas caviae]